MYLGYNWLITQKDYANQCLFCKQQAMASGFVHLSELPLSLTAFDFFLRGYLRIILELIRRYQYCD